ncbi:MAG: holo-[acyl-carrier-protein] synthase [Clostridia bacterium]|nr:holo-[acyl-carrier-protein] synthase [Erysipelotrichia bacterium]NCC87582.1 holo-[acyl-carrier-protein] synthase [Clostridia bacterium]
MMVGIGCDIVEIKRLENKQEALAKRILSEQEYHLYQSFPKKRAMEFLAGRFAAKEAIVKACPQNLLLNEIEVLYDDFHKPICSIKNYQIHISIAHENAYAIAYAICEK